MTWHTRFPNWLESDGGRFDIFRSERTGEWVALDSDRGRTFRCDSIAAAQEWCREQVREMVAAK